MCNYSFIVACNNFWADCVSTRQQRNTAQCEHEVLKQLLYLLLCACVCVCEDALWYVWQSSVVLMGSPAEVFSSLSHWHPDIVTLYLWMIYNVAPPACTRNLTQPKGGTIAPFDLAAVQLSLCTSYWPRANTVSGFLCCCTVSQTVQITSYLYTHKHGSVPTDWSGSVHLM